MIRETTLLMADSDDADVRRLYETAFPEQERIPFDDMRRLGRSMPIELNVYHENDVFVGFTIILKIERLNWFWYFAVEKDLRGKGLGQRILSTIIKRYADKPLIIDIESPDQPSDNEAQRRGRHKFYKRNGFRDTGIHRTFDGLTFSILVAGEGDFTSKDYDALLEYLREHWKDMPQAEDNGQVR